MTEENKQLRETLINIEQTVVQCLHSQPAQDEPCRRHLLRTLLKLAEMVRPYQKEES